MNKLFGSAGIVAAVVLAGGVTYASIPGPDATSSASATFGSSRSRSGEHA